MPPDSPGQPRSASTPDRPPTVLLLGEGDFTFALALSKLVQGDVRLVATGYDSETTVCERYPPAKRTLVELKKKATVLHSIDATKLELRADEVVFTHPHLGDEDAQRHHALLAHFFHAVEAPLVHVTLAGDQVENWRAVDAGERHGYRLVSRTPFRDSQFPGYTRRRSLRSSSFRRRVKPDSTTLSFARDNYDGRKTPFWIPYLSPEADPVQCDLCGKFFDDDRALQKHKRDAVHSSSPKLVCDLCGAVCADPLALDRHTRTKHNMALRPADLKPDWFLRQHQENPEDDDNTSEAASTRCLCPICGQGFPDVASRQRHIDDDFRPVERRRDSHFTCVVCGRTFRDYRALAQHCIYASHDAEASSPPLKESDGPPYS